MSNAPAPVSFSPTRDNFAFDLVVKETIVEMGGRKGVIKREYYFSPDNTPENFKDFMNAK
jgi:hypothetical protein